MSVGKKDISCPPSGEGTPISFADIEKGEITTCRHAPDIRYSWATGQAVSRYLDELKRGKLIATKCDHCHRILFPPRIFCELCYRSIDDWVYVKDTGTVETFSISYIDENAERLDEPIIVAVIAVDGASPKMGLMHRIDEVKPEDVSIGMKVKAVWKPEEEREGAVTDIKYWKKNLR